MQEEGFSSGSVIDEAELLPDILPPDGAGGRPLRAGLGPEITTDAAGAGAVAVVAPGLERLEEHPGVEESIFDFVCLVRQ